MDFPNVSFDYFKYGFSKNNRNIFNFLLGLVFIISLITVFVEINPFEYNVEVRKDIQPVATEVPLNKFSTKYIEIEQKLPAFSGMSYFFASLIKPNNFVIITLTFTLFLAWSIILASVSEMKKTIKTVVYIAFGIYLYAAKFPELLGMKDFSKSILVFIGLIIPVVLILWLFEKKKLNILTKTLILLSYNLIIGGLAFYLGKYAGVHSFVSNTFPVLVIILLLYLVISSHTLIFSWIWLSYQRKDKNKRFPFPVFILGSIFLIAFIGFVFIRRVILFDISLIVPVIPFSAVLLIINVLFVFIFQNFFIANQRLFGKNSAFSLGILGLILLVNSFVLFHFIAGEYLFMDVLNHIGWLLTLGGSIGGFVYVIREHRDMLFYKVNLFYEIFRRATNSYITIWFILLFLVSGWEYYQKRRDLILMIAVQTNAKADRQLLQNKLDDAKTYYQMTLFYSPFEPKANYNTAGILIKQNEAPEYIIKHYKEATKLFPLTFAKLNLINYYIIKGYYDEATREGIYSSPEQFKDFRIFVNGSFAAFLNKDFDNSLNLLKKAGNINPNAPEVFANISALYAIKQKFNKGEKFIKEAIKINPKALEVQLNGSLYSFANDSIKIDINENLSDELRYNKALKLYNEGQYKKSYELGRVVFDSTFTTDWGYMDILYMCNLAKLDSLDLALSSYSTNDKVLPPHERIILNHQLGGILTEFNSPEKANEFFYKAASMGLKKDSLYAAILDIVGGNHEEGLHNLTMFVMRNPSSQNVLIEKKLSAILYRAYGDNESYEILTNFLKKLTPEDYFIIGKIAEQTSNINIAVDFFSQYVEKIDSTDPLPYRITGQIYYDNKDLQMAEETWLLGHKRNPKSDLLNSTLAWFYDKQNKKQEALKFMSLTKNDPFKALTLLYIKGIVNAIQEIKGPWKYEEDFNKILAEGLIKHKLYDAGQNHFYNLVQINDKNPYFWAYLAIFSLKINMTDDYEFCKNKATMNARNPFTRKKIDELLKPYDKEYEEKLAQEI